MLFIPCISRLCYCKVETSVVSVMSIPLTVIHFPLTFQICGFFFFFFFYHHILASICFLVLLKSHSNRCKVIAHCGFDLYFFDDQVILSRFNFFNLYKCIIIEGRKTTTKNCGVTMWSCIHKAVGRKMNKGHKQMTHKVRLTSQQIFEKNVHSYQ